MGRGNPHNRHTINNHAKIDSKYSKDSGVKVSSNVGLIEARYKMNGRDSLHMLLVMSQWEL